MSPRTPKTPVTKKATPSKKVLTVTKQANTLSDLRAELFSLKMKHSLRELKEVHLIKKARRAIARHLTQLNNSI